MVDTVADRLKAAIGGWGSINAFAQEMASRQGRVRGTSKQMIHRYLKGGTNPSVEFLEEAAELLGVRAAWLAFGDGEPTEESGPAPRVPRLENRASIETNDGFDVFDTIAVGLYATFPEVRDLPDYIQSLLSEAAFRTVVLNWRGRAGQDQPADVYKKAGERIGLAACSPLEILRLRSRWGLEPPRVSRRRLIAYLTAMGPALHAAIPESHLAEGLELAIERLHSNPEPPDEEDRDAAEE